MKKTWLWNIGRPEQEVREALKNPADSRFVHYAALLLSRSNVPKEVFGTYLDQKDFCLHWQAIKRRMRQNKWDQPRILFWDEIYKHLAKETKKSGKEIRPPKVLLPASLPKQVGKAIRDLRVREGMTQLELAKKAGVHQQVISKIESGTGNPSLRTVEKIKKHLRGNFGINIVETGDHITSTFQLPKHRPKP